MNLKLIVMRIKKASFFLTGSNRRIAQFEDQLLGYMVQAVGVTDGNIVALFYENHLN